MFYDNTFSLKRDNHSVESLLGSFLENGTIVNITRKEVHAQICYHIRLCSNPPHAEITRIQTVLRQNGYQVRIIPSARSARRPIIIAKVGAPNEPTGGDSFPPPKF